MKIKYIWMLFFGALFLNSCIREDYFGESEYANIKNILVSNQSGNAVINNENALVVVEIPAGVDLSKIKLKHWNFHPLQKVMSMLVILLI